MIKTRMAVRIALLTMVFAAISCITAAAKEYSTDKLSFTLSDNWIQVENGDEMIFYRSPSKDEHINIIATSNDIPMLWEPFDDNTLTSICKKTWSNSNIAESFQESNPNARNLTVSEDSTKTGHEWHNGNEFYRFEKASTVSATGYHNYPYYVTQYTTFRGGVMYTFLYERTNSTNNFKEFIAMLDSFTPNIIKIKINGQTIIPDSDPVIVYGRTLVPIRSIAETLGYTVNWDGTSRQVLMNKGSEQIIFQIDNDSAYKNSTPYTIDVPPMIFSDRTYLPVRAVTELMGAKVDWDGTTRTVTINK